ncbi:ATP-binding protein [uncultured Methanomethylovorans sp.]|uniref:helicase HerA domain-containing protein n=1 Tax=uncultured Methanomethylovorans sp. TaxID=183759 RepID=UPI00262EEAA4|nr:ATP-binding protein [uncultured Methanomethylovorans sp.]
MVRDAVGVIFGEAGTSSFRILLSDSTSVHQGEYIKAWHEIDGWVLAQVLSITRSGDSYTIEEAKNGSRKDKSGDRIIADVTVIGKRDDSGLLRSPSTPFSPGDPIYKANNELICSSLGLSGKEMFIGMLEGTDIPVHLNVNSLVQKHCSILAKTGSGKSYTAGVLLEEMLDRKVPLLIIDPHSEYASLKEEGVISTEVANRFKVSPRSYAQYVTVYTPANKSLNPKADEVFRLNGMNLTAKELSEAFPNNFTSTHIGILYEAIDKIKAEMDTYSLDEIIFEVKNNDSKAKWNIISFLEEIRETGILSTNPTSIEDLVQPGRASIIDFKGVAPDIQSMIVARLCSALFEARKMNTIPPGMLVVEEAHNYAPEKGFSKTLSSDVLRTIASEGRKFGLGMMVISQRPARVDKNILSQCGTQIIMKVTNPNDLKAISKGLEGVSSYVEDELMRLPPGVAMLVSTDIERPILVDIRVRKSKHGGESVNVMRSVNLNSAQGASARKPPVESVPMQPVMQEHAESHHIGEEHMSVQATTAPPPKRKPSREVKTDEGGGLFKKIFGASK